MMGWVAMITAVAAAAAGWLVWDRHRRLARLFDSHLPAYVTGKAGWWCVVFISPGRRTWVVPNAVGESSVMMALSDVARSYPAWIPEHGMVGRGANSRWIASVRRPSFATVPVCKVFSESSSGGMSPVGLGLDGKPVLIRGDVSTCVVGLTGSGKGSVMATLIEGYRGGREWGSTQIWGIDLKGGVELSMYGGGRFFSRHAYSMQEAIGLLGDLSVECDRRMDAMRGKSRDWEESLENPRIVLVIDEAAELHNKTDRKNAERATQLLDSILRRGRALGVTVVAFSQDPRLESLPLRNRFPQRIALRLNSRDEAEMALGTEAVMRGAAPWLISPRLPGAGYVWDPERGEALFFRAPWFSDDTLRKWDAGA